MLHQPGVLVTFYSIDGLSERLALACAVGAVEARGRIRLRRVPDEGASPASAVETEAMERMRKEYVTPTDRDIEWADALVLCGTGRAPGWRLYLEALDRLHRAGRIDGKIGALVGTAEPAGTGPVAGDNLPRSPREWEERLLGFGLIGVPSGRETPQSAGEDAAVVGARLVGRRVIGVARALRARHHS